MKFHSLGSADAPAGSAVAGAPAPDKILDGAPAFRTWLAEASTPELQCGIWEATPGAWLSEKGSDQEFFTVLAGLSEFTEQGKEAVRLVPGSTFIMQPGCVGTWRVIETTIKSFVIRKGDVATSTR